MVWLWNGWKHDEASRTNYLQFPRTLPRAEVKGHKRGTIELLGEGPHRRSGTPITKNSVARTANEENKPLADGQQSNDQERDPPQKRDPNMAELAPPTKRTTPSPTGNDWTTNKGNLLLQHDPPTMRNSYHTPPTEQRPAPSAGRHRTNNKQSTSSRR